MPRKRGFRAGGRLVLGQPEPLQNLVCHEVPEASLCIQFQVCVCVCVVCSQGYIRVTHLTAIWTAVLQVSENGPGHKLLSLSSKQGLLPVKHGYIFNLCVTETARRNGVATALMKEAVHVAQTIQMRTLYVHVEAHNDSALVLYQKLGYIVEEEEPLDVEYRFQRPRRILLSYRFP